MIKTKTTFKYLSIIFICLLAFAFGTLNFGVTAEARTVAVNNASTLNSVLNNLKNYDGAEIHIGGNGDIDYSDYDHIPINLASYVYEELEISIYFDASVKNVWHRTSGALLDATENYGLFTYATNGYVPVYYKVNFDAGEGTIVEGYNYYRFGSDNVLPSVTAPEGSTFKHWAYKDDPSQAEVSKISATTWGVLDFVAVYETIAEPTPTTYPIVYSDTMLGTSIESENDLYTLGTSLSLESLVKNGFSFVGWEVAGGQATIKELPEDLPAEYLSNDGKIYLDAVWELESPTLASLSGISKIYDGNESTLEIEVSHSAIEELELAYVWYKAGSEEDKNTPTACGTKEKLTFLMPEENYYKVDVKVTHRSSGLESAVVSSDWVKVKIDRATIEIELANNVIVTKPYDGNKEAIGLIELGTHYFVNGIVGSDLVDVTLSSAEFASANVGDSVVTVYFSSLSFGDSSLEKCYEFTPVSYQLQGRIEQIELSLNKLSAPTITKDYDGTTLVDYDFTEGVDYSFNGGLGAVEHTISASYDNKNAGERVVTLTISFENDNYCLADNKLEFDASINAKTITPIKLSVPTISKDYDGTRAVEHTFERGVDYELEGALENEIIGVSLFSSYDRKDVTASLVCLLFGELEFAEGVRSENYDYVKNYHEINYLASITPCVLSLSPQNAKKTYGEKDELSCVIYTGIMDEEITIKYLREEGERAGEYEYNGVEMVISNANYLLSFVATDSKFTIEPKIPTLIFPSFKAMDYSASATLNNAVLDSEGYEFIYCKYITELGEFYWLDSDIVPSVENSGYIMVFLPNDTHNYDYTSLEGYSEMGEIVIRNIPLTILPIDPVPALIDESFTLAIGMLWSNLTLPQGWKLVDTIELDTTSVVRGNVGENITYPNALSYSFDDTKNYNVIYKDLVVNLSSTVIAYTYKGEKIYSGNQTNISSGLNNEIYVSFNLENPFEKVGYKTTKWSFDGIELIPSDENGICIGYTYLITDANLIQNEIVIAVEIAPRSDVKVTYRHFYENIEGSYNDTCDEEIIFNDGVADALRSLVESDIKNRTGFNYIGSTPEGNDFITEFVVSASGDSIIDFYYARKQILISYVDDKYLALNPIGSLPQDDYVKFGVPFELKAPTDYVIYGYIFSGYTDGVTTDGDKLKLFNGSYVVMQDVTSITFTVNMNADNNVGYLVKKYFDNVLTEEMRYGTTGELVDISGETYVGYERVTNAQEVLSGTISGYALDEDGTIIGGSRLELAIYFVKKKYQIEIEGSLGLDGFEAVEGENIILPSAPTKVPDGMQFVGWEINGVLYMAGENFLMPSGNVTLYPRWEKVGAESPEDEIPDEEIPDDNNTPSEPSEGGNENGNETNTIEGDKGGIGVGGIVGIVLGSVAVLSAVLGVALSVAKKNKDRAMIIDRLEAKKHRRGRKS